MTKLRDSIIPCVIILCIFLINFSELDERKPSNSTAKLKRLGEYDPEREITIRDPYFVSNSYTVVCLLVPEDNPQASYLFLRL